jgi:mono/diheme cytochrome c family protein
MRLSLAHLAAVLGMLGLLLLGSGPAWADEGAALYAANCAKCHGADGRAETPVGKAMKVASLVHPKWAAEGSADALVAAFRANPKHKAVASNVSDADLRAIAVHVRGLAAAE